MTADPRKTEASDAVRESREACIEACSACAAECERCTASCLRLPDLAPLARLLALLRTCADVCLLTARLLAQESDFASEYGALCAEVCHTCREECLQHSTIEGCRQCAEACLKCDQLCQKVAAT